MKVYMDDDNGRRLIGRADVPADTGPAYEIPMFGAASVITERFTVGIMTHLPPGGGGAPVVERAVLAAPGQLVELLPGRRPLAS